jgi:hypothetical protein
VDRALRRRAIRNRLARDRLLLRTGGDLLALVQAGTSYDTDFEAWDLDPIACLLAAANLNALDAAVAAKVRFFPQDVSQTAPASAAFWRIDPARRAAGRRSTQPAAHSPPASVFLPWLRHAPHAAIKLSPAAELSDAWPGDLQLEWISRDRQCRQLLVSSGDCVVPGGPRRATRVESGTSSGPPGRVSFAGEPDVPLEAASAPEGRLWEPDPSIIAARLTGALAAATGLRSLGPGSVYLTGDAAVAPPLLTEFEVVESLPLRAATVAKWLSSRDIGRVEVKCRGVDLDPDQFIRQLRLPAGGEGRGTVFLTRIGPQRVAIVTRRIAGPRLPTSQTTPSQPRCNASPGSA